MQQIQNYGPNQAIEKYKQKFNQKEHWYLENNQIQTNIEALESNDIIGNGYYESIIKRDFEIYTSFERTEGNIPINGNYNIDKFIYDLFIKVKTGYLIAPICLILGVLMILYILNSIGHKKGKEGITLNWIDQIPLEILAIIGGIIITIEIFICILPSADEAGIAISDLMWYITVIYGIYLTSMYLFASLVRRIKARVIFKNTITYKLGAKIFHGISNIVHNIKSGIKPGWVLPVTYISFILITCILLIWGQHSGFSTLLLLSFWLYVFYRISKKIGEYAKIREAIKEIYEGKSSTVYLNEEEFSGRAKEISIYLNDIAGGFSNAIEESLKSERMKTELITNVSHDLKTPLTSIINYVDLLKKEEIQNDKVKEYLDVLDNKSQRLKKLTEDLVEASKASSGTIKLNMEKLNVKELIKQSIGEFEDKFEAKGLEIIPAFPEEEINIQADSRYMYRILENIYSNLVKYALENSRVYLDVIKNNNKVIIAIKNISKERLNISAEELMQRFVRGDSSRNTEGSGLGLSIAQSLAKLQNGSFTIYLDGDLFKVVLEFEISEKKD